MEDLAKDGFVGYGALMHCAVYALVRRGEVVYVGKSKSLGERLLSHIRARTNRRIKRTGFPGNNRFEKGFGFDDIWVRKCMLAELDQLEIDMIRKYQPRYNNYNKNVEGYPPELRELIKTISVPPPAQPVAVFRRRV